MAKKKVSKKKTTKMSASKSVRQVSAASTNKSTTKKTAKVPTKKTAKKSTTKTSGTAAKKTVGKKKITKKKVVKKSTRQAPAKKPASPKPASTKKVAKKIIKKALKKDSKKVTKKVAKKVSKKTTKKSASPSKTAPVKAPDAAVSPQGMPAPDSTPKPQSGKPPQTDTSADSSPKKRRPSKSKKIELVMPIRPLLLGPNGPSLKPLIPSGKNNKLERSVLENVTSRRTKTPLTKAQLDKYRMILLAKRAELLGDMRNLEEEALRSDTGRAGSGSKNIEESGSESYEQSLNLNLAATERERINEIDAALKRIDNRTYGLCELTFEPINKARLDEIPWARFTIAAARELDRWGNPR